MFACRALKQQAIRKTESRKAVNMFNDNFAYLNNLEHVRAAASYVSFIPQRKTNIVKSFAGTFPTLSRETSFDKSCSKK